MAFSANGVTRKTITGTCIRIESETQPKESNEKAINLPCSLRTLGFRHNNEVWIRANAYAYDRLWFGYILPGFLQSEGVIHSNNKMSIPNMVQKMSDLWATKSKHEINPKISVVLNFAPSDNLLQEYTGEIPTKYDKNMKVRLPVKLNAIDIIKTDGFKWWVMTPPEGQDAIIPKNMFFAIHPVKYKCNPRLGVFSLTLLNKKL